MAVVLCVGCAPEFRFANEHLDLGAVLPGEVNLRQVDLLSRSDSSMKLGGTSSNNPDFTLEFSPSTLLLAPNDITVLTVQHTPPRGATEPQQAELRAWTEEGLESSVEVTSHPVTPECDVPEFIDFGAVKVGERVTRALPLRNTTAFDTEAEVKPASSSANVYAVEDGRYPIRANDETNMPLTFRPAFTAEFVGTFTVRRHLLCQPQRVTLRGTGVTSLIAAQQQILGWNTLINTTEAQQLTLLNRSFSAVELFDVQVNEGTIVSPTFRATRIPVRIPAAVRSETGLLIPGDATIEISFTPPGVETHFGQLLMSTDLAEQPQLGIDLQGTGHP